jgi:signal transduction histidine kinase
MTAEDLARRAALAIDNAKLYEKAQRAIDVREEMLALVSHDLRSPLNTITMGASALLEESTERRASHAKYLQLIKRAAEQANVMIKNLLDVSGIESGNFSVDPTPLAVSDILKQVRDQFLPIVTEASIALKYELSSDVNLVLADATELQRVFSNLVGNAIKFTPEGGVITLRAERAADEVRFSVVDTGVGIPREHIPLLFDRYWQAKRGDRRGAGLGLSIAKGIVEAHNGSIWVESETGKGATFGFSLPIALEEWNAR